MLDASGSISQMFKSLVEQVITLTEFCRTVNIPFKVYLFGACYGLGNRWDMSSSSHFIEYEPHAIARVSKNEKLIEVMNSEQSLSDYNLAIYSLYHTTGFDFGETPMVSGILSIEKSMLELFDKNRIQSKKLIILTDGGPTDTNGQIHNSWDTRNRSLWIYDKGTRTGFVDTKDTFFRPVDIIARILKNRYDVETLVLAVATSLQSLKMMRSYIVNENSFTKAEQSVIREFGFLEEKTYHNSPVIYIKAVSAEVDNFDIDVDENDTLNKIKAKFSKKFNTIRKSKVLLNTLVSHLVF